MTDQPADYRRMTARPRLADILPEPAESTMTSHPRRIQRRQASLITATPLTYFASPTLRSQPMPETPVPEKAREAASKALRDALQFEQDYGLQEHERARVVSHVFEVLSREGFVLVSREVEALNRLRAALSEESADA